MQYCRVSSRNSPTVKCSKSSWYIYMHILLIVWLTRWTFSYPSEKLCWKIPAKFLDSEGETSNFYHRKIAIEKNRHFHKLRRKAYFNFDRMDFGSESIWKLTAEEMKWKVGLGPESNRAQFSSRGNPIPNSIILVRVKHDGRSDHLQLLLRNTLLQLRGLCLTTLCNQNTCLHTFEWWVSKFRKSFEIRQVVVAQKWHFCTVKWDQCGVNLNFFFWKSSDFGVLPGPDFQPLFKNNL